MAYPESLIYSEMRDIIEVKLQDTGNSNWATTELDLYIEEGLRELANFHPHIYKAEFYLENRSGTATTDTANALVDATNDQFLSTDVGKWVYNKDDRTWAQVTAYVDETQLTLSNDCFPDGNEGYQIYNKYCDSEYEFSIDAPQQPDGALGKRTFDWLWIDKIEYPILRQPPRILSQGEWDLEEHNVVDLKISDTIPDTSETDAQDEVWVYFALKHKLSQLTTLLGKVNNGAGYSVGDVAINADDLQTTGTLYKGQEFTIDNCRGIYIADYQRSISSGAVAPLTFWPPLKDNISDDETIRFVSSTLPHKLEGIFADLTAGKGAMNKASKYADGVWTGEDPYTMMYQWGRLKYEAAVRELQGLRGYKISTVALP